MRVELERKDNGTNFEVDLEDFTKNPQPSLKEEHIQLLQSDTIRNAANILYKNGEMTHSYLQNVSELETIDDIPVKEAINTLLKEVQSFFEQIHPDKNISAFNPLIRDGKITNYLPRVHKDYGNNALPGWRRYKAWICLNPEMPEYSLCLCAHKNEYENEISNGISNSGNQKLPPLIGDLNVHEDGRWGWFRGITQSFILFDGERVYHSAFCPSEGTTKNKRISIEIRVTCTPKKESEK